MLARAYGKDRVKNKYLSKNSYELSRLTVSLHIAFYVVHERTVRVLPDGLFAAEHVAPLTFKDLCITILDSFNLRDLI